jgi:DNA-binding transcriptional regulator/RsmH inhibitor MraZ
MTELLGTYHIKLEETGRIRLPQDVIDYFEDTAYLVEGDGPHISILPKQTRDDLLKAYRELPQPRDPEIEWRLRELTASLKEVPVKVKGRLSIPKEYRQICGLDGGEDILLIGVLDHLEIWDPETYKAAKERRRAHRLYGR